MPLSDAERSLRARLGGLTRSATEDSRERTALARAKGPGQKGLAYFLEQVEPDLPEPERIRRATALRGAYFTRLSLAAARARRQKRDAS